MQPQPLRLRLLKLAILLSFLICYLEWGTDKSGFIFQFEYEIIAENKLTDSITHPFIFLPLLGQLLLIISVIVKNPHRRLTALGIVMLSLLVLMILLVGILSLNFKIIASTVPFLAASIYYFKTARKIKLNEP